MPLIMQKKVDVLTTKIRSQRLRRVMILAVALPKTQRIDFTGSIYLSLFHIAYFNHSKTAIPILTFYKSVLIAGKKRGGNPPRCTPPLFKKYTGYTDECYASRIASASSLQASMRYGIPVTLAHSSVRDISSLRVIAGMLKHRAPAINCCSPTLIFWP